MDMEKASQLRLQFYQLLGKLFFAIASIDSVVRDKEIEQLRRVLNQEWIPLEDTEDDFGADSAYQIEIVFDWLLKNEIEIESVLADFDAFKREHPSLFPKNVNKLILKTANTIANSFAGKNKLEQSFIQDLNKIVIT